MLILALLSHYSVRNMINNELKNTLRLEDVETDRLGKFTTQQLTQLVVSCAGKGRELVDFCIHTWVCKLYLKHSLLSPHQMLSVDN